MLGPSSAHKSHAWVSRPLVKSRKRAAACRARPRPLTQHRARTAPILAVAARSRVVVARVVPLRDPQNAQSRVRPLDRRPFDGRRARRGFAWRRTRWGYANALSARSNGNRRPRVVEADVVRGLRGGTRDLNARRPPTGTSEQRGSAAYPPPPAATFEGGVIWCRAAHFSACSGCQVGQQGPCGVPVHRPR